VLKGCKIGGKERNNDTFHMTHETGREEWEGRTETYRVEIPKKKGENLQPPHERVKEMTEGVRLGPRISWGLQGKDRRLLNLDQNCKKLQKRLEAQKLQRGAVGKEGAKKSISQKKGLNADLQISLGGRGAKIKHGTLKGQGEPPVGKKKKEAYAVVLHHR